MNNKKAFTLVELMIVIAIIGILAAALFPSLTGYLSRGRDTKRMSDLRRISGAIEIYRNDNGSYPNAYMCSAGPGNQGGCLSSWWWDCWGSDEVPVGTANNNCSHTYQNSRLLPVSYMPTIPQDVWASRGDGGDACVVGSTSSLYGYMSENTGIGYVLTARMENVPSSSNTEYYTGTRMGCTGYANWAIIIGNGGHPIASGAIGR